MHPVLTRFLILLLLTLSTSLPVPTWAINPPAFLPAKSSRTPWQVAFSEDFNSKRLNTARWHTCYHWASAEEGCTNQGNQEQQWYLPPNVLQKNGVLSFTALKKRHDRFAYTSGMISSHKSFDFKYGYFEMRAKLPAGPGIWPAFWLLPSSRQWPPEIDVVEMLGQEPNKIYMSVHYKEGDQTGQHQGSYVGPNFSADYHVFGCLWQKNLLVWYVDGKERFRTTKNVPDERMYLLANLAVGGRWPGSPNAATRFPATMLIDYIRVWQ